MVECSSSGLCALEIESSTVGLSACRVRWWHLFEEELPLFHFQFLRFLHSENIHNDVCSTRIAIPTRKTSIKSRSHLIFTIFHFSFVLGPEMISLRQHFFASGLFTFSENWSCNHFSTSPAISTNLVRDELDFFLLCGPLVWRGVI